MAEEGLPVAAHALVRQGRVVELNVDAVHLEDDRVEHEELSQPGGVGVPVEVNKVFVPGMVLHGGAFLLGELDFHIIGVRRHLQRSLRLTATV
eukprot:scaffold504772_cov33-Prasinocladus_malaysianus.AAC.1